MSCEEPQPPKDGHVGPEVRPTNLSSIPVLSVWAERETASPDEVAHHVVQSLDLRRVSAAAERGAEVEAPLRGYFARGVKATRRLVRPQK